MGCDDDHNHDGFERHDFSHYYLSITIFQQFTAAMARLTVLARPLRHHFAMRMGPLIASGLAFSQRTEEVGSPCDAAWVCANATGQPSMRPPAAWCHSRPPNVSAPKPQRGRPSLATHSTETRQGVSVL